MTTVERLPPACAFAVSVLTEYNVDPDAVPEEAVEAAQHHLNTCQRCIGTQTAQKISHPTETSTQTTLSSTIGTPGTSSTSSRKKKVSRDSFDVQERNHGSKIASVESKQSSLLSIPTPEPTLPITPLPETIADPLTKAPSNINLPVADVSFNEAKANETRNGAADAPSASATTLSALDLLNVPMNEATSSISCVQCRTKLKNYAEAMDNGENASELYPEIEEHLAGCESGCLILLDIYRQEAKATRKYRRRPVRNPFSAIAWETTGFFRGGQVPMSPMALSYGTLILLLLVASLSAFLGIRWDDARYYHPPVITLPTPDGVGISDGLNIYDACNTVSYNDKREAAQAMRSGNLATAQSLLKAAMNAPLADTTGCNGAEAAIYLQDLQVRQSGRAYGIVVVSFDSGTGDTNPRGGTDRHVLYAPYTQELIGAYIGQQQYNATQMKTAGAPLLYLVLANSTGTASGAMQIASDVVALKAGHMDGLLITSPATSGTSAASVTPTTSVTTTTATTATPTSAHSLLAVLGLGPDTLVQNILPVLCTTGVPLISPTATGQFLVNSLTQQSFYQHCAAGFSFIRFSPGDTQQSDLAANYAYKTLHVHKVALFYDPNAPSSMETAQNFQGVFVNKKKHTQVVVQETAIDGSLLDANDQASQAAHDALLAQLRDALAAKPELIFAPLSTNDIIILAQAIAQLPQNQQPILMVGGTFVPPSSLQRIVQWARQQQLSLPRIFVTQSAVVHSPAEGWQKQFYATLCTSFAASGNYCSGTASADQGALLFGDSIQMVTTALGPLTSTDAIPTTAQLVEKISKEQFAGVSGPVALHIDNSVVMVSTKAVPVLLGIQGDGSIQILG